MSNSTSRGASGAVLTVTGLGHSYRPDEPGNEILSGIDIVVGDAEFVCIVGPSGVGKSTLLRCLAGLQRSTAGSIDIEGEPLTGPSPKIGLVFQDYSRSLLPWMKVADNVTLPLRGRMARSERDARASAALAEVGLDGAHDAYPWQLSGGMQQRVAIARALVYQPRVLLMDEPFASVDAQTRETLEDLMLRVRDETGTSIMLITHDIDEAIYLADRVVVLGGRPAGVRATLEVPFGRGRDQLGTKAEPEFARLRHEVHRLIGESSSLMTGSVQTVRV